MRQVNEGLISPEAIASLPVHPTQLYAAVAGFLVVGVLLVYGRRDRRPGEVMAFLMIAYSVTRWPIESLRSDEPAVFLGMTWSQNISVALMAGGIALFMARRRQPGFEGDTEASARPGTDLIALCPIGSSGQRME